tara:strand:- start:54 stop:341 length:288 start_codon:yes stop_codon:yes gene_type:complete
MLIKVILVILGVLIVASVLMQQGKGSDLGSAFGGGSSDSLFGPLGPSNFLSQLTWGLTGIFFILCLTLAYLSKEDLSLNIQEEQIEEVQEEPPVE